MSVLLVCSCDRQHGESFLRCGSLVQVDYVNGFIIKKRCYADLDKGSIGLPPGTFLRWIMGRLHVPAFGFAASSRKHQAACCLSCSNAPRFEAYRSRTRTPNRQKTALLTKSRTTSFKRQALRVGHPLEVWKNGRASHPVVVD
jgi:hypothetical protein